MMEASVTNDIRNLESRIIGLAAAHEEVERSATKMSRAITRGMDSNSTKIRRARKDVDEYGDAWGEAGQLVDGIAPGLTNILALSTMAGGAAKIVYDWWEKIEQDIAKSSENMKVFVDQAQNLATSSGNTVGGPRIGAAAADISGKGRLTEAELLAAMNEFTGIAKNASTDQIIEAMARVQLAASGGLDPNAVARATGVAVVGGMDVNQASNVGGAAVAASGGDADSIMRIVRLAVATGADFDDVFSTALTVSKGGSSAIEPLLEVAKRFANERPGGTFANFAAAAMPQFADDIRAGGSRGAATNFLERQANTVAQENPFFAVRTRTMAEANRAAAKQSARTRMLAMHREIVDAGIANVIEDDDSGALQVPLLNHGLQALARHTMTHDQRMQLLNARIEAEREDAAREAQSRADGAREMSFAEGMSALGRYSRRTAEATERASRTQDARD